MSFGDSFLKKALGEDFFESLQKSFEIYKPGTRTTLDPEEMKTALQIVPRTLMSFLVNHLSPLKVGDNHRTELPLQESGVFLNVTKLERDQYIGSIEKAGKIITDFKFRSIPGIGLVIMSAFELYDINKLIDPPKVEEDVSAKVQTLINERLAMHDIVSQVVDKTMAEREALNKLMLMKLTDELNATRDELERERVRLAGAGAAAIGYAKDVKPGDYGHSASLDDVNRLYDEKERLRKENEVLKSNMKGSQKLKSFIEGRKKPQEFSIEMAKGEHVNCPDCGKNIFDGQVFAGCICLGDDRERKVFIKKSDDKISVRFSKGWDAENIEMLLEILRRKRGK